MGFKRSFCVAFLVTLAGLSGAFAQVIKAPVEAVTAARIGQDEAPSSSRRVIQFVNEEPITISFVLAPVLGGAVSGNGEGVNWLKVEFHYGVNPADPKKNPWVDAVEFKIWIEGRDLYAANAPAGSQDGVAVCLTGSCTYVNLEQARDAYGVFYVHPTAVTRYSGRGGPDDFDRKFNVHVEAYVGGKLVDYNDKKKDVDKWWMGPTQVPDIVLRQDQTPFVNYDVGRYPQIKLPSPASTP
jgi:hypothetical protein